MDAATAGGTLAIETAFQPNELRRFIRVDKVAADHGVSVDVVVRAFRDKLSTADAHMFFVKDDLQDAQGRTSVSHVAYNPDGLRPVDPAGGDEVGLAMEPLGKRCKPKKRSFDVDAKPAAKRRSSAGSWQKQLKEDRDAAVATLNLERRNHATSLKALQAKFSLSADKCKAVEAIHKARLKLDAADKARALREVRESTQRSVRALCAERIEEMEHQVRLVRNTAAYADGTRKQKELDRMRDVNASRRAHMELRLKLSAQQKRERVRSAVRERGRIVRAHVGSLRNAVAGMRHDFELSSRHLQADFIRLKVSAARIRVHEAHLESDVDLLRRVPNEASARADNSEARVRELEAAMRRKDKDLASLSWQLDRLTLRPAMSTIPRFEISVFSFVSFISFIVFLF